MKSLAKLLGLTGNERTDGGLFFHPSEKCPECGTTLASFRSEEVAWHCPNLDCPAQERERIKHWCSAPAMDIADGNPELVAKLVAKGLVRDAAELYRLKIAEIEALEGMDRESAQKFFDAITASQTRDMWRVLFGLGIMEVGEREARALGRQFSSLDAVFAAGEAQLMKADGIGEAVARNIARWWADSRNRNLVKRLNKAGVNFKSGLYGPDKAGTAK